MEPSGGSSASYTPPNAAVSAAMASPSNVADTSKASQYEFDPSVSEEEKRFYLKAYPTVDVVRDRKTHCTVCKIHIGTAPVQENGIKMHPILRVTHCNKCHDFYNSGEFSKGEDGSELYCRWCGQGGEVYCCSSCPYVFCKSCIVKNLSRGVVADIEQNENWNCFSCAPKILWPLRAQHWALMNYIEQQKKEIYAMNLSEADIKQHLSKDRSKCCRLAKAKCGNMSDSMESLDSITSKRSHTSTSSAKKPIKHSATSPQQANTAKRAKNNDEVVCTPDLLSMLEPDCQITVSSKTNRPLTTPSASTPKIMSIQQPPSGFGTLSPMAKSSVPPPLVLRNTAVKLRQVAPPPIVRRTIIGPRTPSPGGSGTPVYHTINGYRIDLNSAAQQETFRLPNGKLIQVKRQGPPPNASSSPNNWQQMNSPQQQRFVPQTIASRPIQISAHPYNISVQSQSPQIIRYHSNVIGSTSINSVNQNGAPMQAINGQVHGAPQQPQQQQLQQTSATGPVRPVMVRHVFPDNPIGQARSGLQDQVFNAMEICTHLTNKVQTLTNSNAYKQARNFLEVKELYIHLSYLLTYAIGRFKSLQDKCLGDMRTLGFGNDADCLENGQLAADKQASDDEDNEIEIVEPKTDLITLDSDDDEAAASSRPSGTPANEDIKVKLAIPPASLAPRPEVGDIPALSSATRTEQPDENMDLMSMAQSFLASMLEVDIQDGPSNSPGSDSSGHKKQPRKKLTNKPNPTLIKQKALMERERLEEMKRNDAKLKMKCLVELKKAEEEYPFTKDMLEAQVKEKQKTDASEYEGESMEKNRQVKLLVETDKETLEVELIVEDDNLNSSSEENKSIQCLKLVESCETEKKNNNKVEEEKPVENIQNQEDDKNTINDKMERNGDGNQKVTVAEDKNDEEKETDLVKNDIKITDVTMDSNIFDRETINESNVKTAELTKNNEDTLPESNTSYDVNNSTDELKKDNESEPMEMDDKMSTEQLDNSNTVNTEMEVDIDKEIEKVLLRKVDDTNCNEFVNEVACNNSAIEKGAIKENDSKEVDAEFKSKKQISIEATAVAASETTIKKGAIKENDLEETDAEFRSKKQISIEATAVAAPENTINGSI